MKETVQTVLKEVEEVLERSVEDSSFSALADLVKSAPRIFIAGEGRSGLVGKMIAMRLMHSGFTVYVTGETITPSIQKNDLLMILSGSGKTGNLVKMADTAKQEGASIACFTTDPASPLAENSHHTVEVKAATKYRREGEPPTIQPLGNQFDQSLHLLLDAFIIHLLKGSPAQSNDSLAKRHANLE
ncbi:6-phospho-3-hexuloisomerase [Alteribacillus sp. HJP-4]|uniref:6-phospho-3-hexuloisomerase n=1 Tax=Alteribacillus sp. HJP-4 TaxID=2775394 RepID=UPI0035CD0528